MHKSAFIFLFCALNATSAFARVPFLSSSHQPSGVADDSERLKNTDRFVPVPNFPKESIEFIREGVVDDELLKQYLQPEAIEYVKQLHLQWLQIRDVRIDKDGIMNVADGVLVPITAGIRYMQSKNWVDGTANAIFHVTRKNGKLDMELVTYDDNAAEQAIGRWYSGIDFMKFANEVAGETLQKFFSTPSNLDALMTIRR